MIETVLIIVVPIIAAWVGFLHKSLGDHDRAIAKLEVKVEGLGEDIKEIKDKINKIYDIIVENKN